SICHTIVAQHGGRIEMASAIGKGTTVTVTLPVDDARPAEPPDQGGRARGQALRSRVLVVDDEGAIGVVLRDMLAPIHDVTVAKGGLEAEALLLHAGAPFDVIVCDLAMPDMPGAELFERVCARRPELSDSFVFMTGGLFPDTVLERCGSAGVPR